MTRTIWKGILWANAAIIFGFWWRGSFELLTQGFPGITIALGKLCGLLAAGFVLFQFISMGRMPWIEGAFGLDNLSRIHHKTGKWSFVFLVLHPILLIIGYSALAQVSWYEQLVVFLFDYDEVIWASLGLLLFGIVVATSITLARKKFRYETWYAVHLLVYIAVYASFGHQIEVGSDIVGSTIFYWYWIGLYTVVFVSHIVFRFLRPLYLYDKHRFRVSRIVRETHNTVSVYITGKNMKTFSIYPGQFMIVRFLAKGLWWQAHPFSLSFVPNGREVRITVKELGDFTNQVHTIPLNTSVMIDGPFGIFTEWVSETSKTLLIAGGIGITPIRALFEQLLSKHKDSVLLYGNKTKKDIVFAKELTVLAHQYKANVVHILSEEPSYDGETGFIDQEKLKRLVPDIQSRDVYICGPAGMLEAIRKTVQTLGVPSQQIHFEKFAL